MSLYNDLHALEAAEELQRDCEAVRGAKMDLVEVVRCKECKHWGRNSGITESPNGHCFHHDIETNGYDFCSYGAKMDGDENAER